MADIETSIGIGIDTSNALAAIKNLQREISAFHTSLAKGSSTAAAASASLQKDLLNNLNATGQFSAQMTTVKSTTESFTTALEKNKLSMGEYFRYAGGASKRFGGLFTKEFDTVTKVARERVKDLQSQYIQLGRDANGALKAIKIRPLVLDMDDLGTKTQIAAQKQQIFNQLLKQGSTNLLNFGKNTQWAGRQLMVGFTIPLTVFGSTAAKTFMELEKQAIRFKRVYGDLFTTPEDADKMVKSLQDLSLEFTKYGVAVEKTMGLAADAAAMGKTGVDLLAQVTEANRLAVLGNVEQAQALETTISVTNAFGVATDKLASKIDFLNAVENQTVTSIEDLTIAIPKAGPVVQQLGGDVEDLAYFLTAMKEGGINASEGANALKSGLASLINPTAKASEFLQGFGINIQNIVNANKGDVKGLVIDFAKALDVLDPLNRAQAIEQLFGKFQFSRLSTLFQNVIAEGTQAERVLSLTNATVQELASLSEKELGNVANSTTYKFQKAVEELRAAIAPVGEQFLKAITPVLEFAAEILNKFNSLSEGVKNFVVIGGGLIAGLGPVFLMTFGLIANGVANIVKGFAAVRNLFLKTKDSSSILGEQIGYMTQEQLDAAAVAVSLERVHEKLQQRFTSEAGAISNLVAAYEKAIRAQAAFSGVPNIRGAAGMKLASGIASVPGPRGAGDIVPAVLSPGEAVIPADAARKYAPIIRGMIAGNLPGYKDGVMLGMPRSGKSTGKNRDAAQQIYEMFLKSSYRDVAPTNYGHQLSPTTGHSFPIFGLGGVYMGPNGQKVFVKPVMDEKAALAEMRATEIARQAHGLKAPQQRIVVIRDPQDPTRQRRFLALESALDSTFVNNDPMAVFNESQYFKQLVASLLRVDKDLSASNVFGDVVADVGPAGVFSRASGLRDYEKNLPSMEDQAMVNLLGIKGGAKRAFAESTLGLMAGLSPQQYHQRMISEIQAVLPALKQTVAGFKLTDPTEVDVYDAMIKRLEQGLTVDWSKFHAIHSAVKPKQSTPAIPGYEDGVVSVPGPKGAGDIQPAMLSPGEAVIPAKMAKKYGPLISAMISGKIPGYADGRAKRVPLYTQAQQFGEKGQYFGQASHFGMFTPSKLSETLGELTEELEGVVVEVFTLGEKLEDGTRKVEKEVGVKLTDLANRDEDMIAGGKSAPGTTTIESKERNQAYNEAKIAGAAFTLEEVVENGKKAAAALAETAPESLKYADQLKQLVVEQEAAEQLLKSSNSTQHRLDFMYENTEKALFESLIATGRYSTTAEARADAEEILARAQLKIAKLAESGMDEEEMLQKAKRIYAAELLQSGTGQFTTGERGSGGGDQRYVASGRGRSNLVTADGSRARAADLPKSGRDTRSILSATYTENLSMGLGKIEAAIASILPAAAKALQKMGFPIGQIVADKVKQGLGINSPSAEYEEITRGVTQGVRAGADDAQQAGVFIGERIADAAAASAQSQGPTVYKLPGLRRVTTDINVYLREMEAFAKKQQAVFDKIKAQHAMLGDSFRAYFGKIASGPASDIKTRKEIPGEGQGGGFEKFNNAAMQVSFAFSSLASVSSMFGTEMGAVNEAMFQLSNAMFALTAVTSLLTLAKESETIATIKSTAAKSFAGLKDIFSDGLLNGFKTLGNKVVGFGKGLSTSIPWIGKLATNFMRFLPVIGLAVTAFTAFKVIADIQEQQKQKIEGMGNAAFAAGEKLKGLASYAGFTPTGDPGARYAETATGATEQETAAKAVEVGKTEEFQADIKDGGKFAQDVANLKAATVEEAKIALQALYVQLVSTAPDATAAAGIEALVRAIAAAADKGDVELELPIQLNPFEAGNEKRIVDYVKGLQDSIPEFKTETFTAAGGGFTGQEITTDNTAQIQAAANTFGSAALAGLEQLRTQFNAGLLEVTDYNNAVKAITDSIAALEPVAAQTAAIKIFDNYGVPPEVSAGITNLNSQILLIKALAAGIQIDPNIYTALDAADDEDATPQEKAAGKTAEIKLNNLLNDTLKDQAKALKDKAQADKKAQAMQDLTAIEDQINALEKNKELLPEVTSLLGSEAQAYKFLADEKWRNLLLDAQQKDKEAGGGTANVDALIASFQELNQLQSESNIDTYIADLEEDAALKKQLEAAGFDAAEAQDILNNSTYRAAAVAAAASGDWQTFIDKMNKIEALTPNTTKGGTPDKTPFEDAIESLQKQRTEILNTANTYAKLRKAGVDAGKAFKIAKDPILAAALAAEKVGTKKWKELLALINKVNALTVVSELKDLTNTNIVDAKTTKNTEFLEKAFTKMGYSAEQIDKIMGQIGDNPELLQKFVNDLKDGKVNAESIRNYLASIKNLKMKVSLEDMEADVSQAFSDIAEGISAQRQQIDLDFEFGTNDSKQNKIDPLTGLPFNTSEMNKKIKAAEAFIAERNYAIDDYEFQLSGIEEKENEINSAYDKRIEALDKVREINSRIADEQKGQLSLADALSRGDIAAAAEAAQQISADAASRALDDQKAALEASRDKELAALTAANGMTRVEIETKIRDLKKEIAQKEEDVLEPQQRSLELAEGYRDAANDAVTYLGKNEDEWKKVESGVKLAKIEAEGYKKAIQDAIDLIPQLKQAYSMTSTGTDVDPNQAEIDRLNKLIADNRRIVNKDKTITAEDKKLMADNVGYIKDLRKLTGNNTTMGGYATGGFVSGSGTATSDSIPAMLSNGEYVINAKTTREIGTDILDAINFGKAPGFAVGGRVNVRDLMAASKAKDNAAVQKRLAEKAIIEKQISLFGKTTSPRSVEEIRNNMAQKFFPKPEPKQTPRPGDASFYKPASTTDAIGKGMQFVMDNVYRGLFGQAALNAKYGVNVGAGDIVDSVATVALNSLPFGVAGKGAKAVQGAQQAKVVNNLAKTLAPTDAEIFKKILGGKFFHGDSSVQFGTTVGKLPPTMGTTLGFKNRTPSQTLPNWFGSDLFMTDSRTLARSYSSRKNISSSNPLTKMLLGTGAFPGSRGNYVIRTSLSPQELAQRMGSGIPGTNFNAATAKTLNLKMFAGKQPPKIMSEFERYGIDLASHQDIATMHHGVSNGRTIRLPLGESTYPRAMDVLGRHGYSGLVHSAGTDIPSLKNLKYGLTSRKPDVFTTSNPELFGLYGDYAPSIWDIMTRPGQAVKGAITRFSRARDLNRLAMGGLVKPKYFNNGGLAMGTDTVPAMLTPGEFVMSKYAVQSHGIDKMKAMNSVTSDASTGDSVYNYSVNVNVQSDANPDQIARAVMTQIRQIDSQRIRGNRF